ncbi:uncharacterized protein MELLADRAFT_123862 [Melampsora larici-populina 98AG31]|uniref:Secreted protein n=1 Tax=Melampsora larici-populina (strain 98AG31 / pathotype 3-4-7) TaxID=747676 RepID=F4RBN8_MELLP|nr:uncharacterized protein MELLADRAFT_123862 [Melampsora larici-populina 98AG31]EGG10131.1 secreted protein [Melampsora larici-populina 98AG31]
MSWNRASPILYLALVFLLVGDLGLYIFADANAIDCNFVWDRPSANNQWMHHWDTQSPGVINIYACLWCGRADGSLPSAYDCIGPTPLTTTGSFDCDAGMEFDSNNALRPIVCYHTFGKDVQTFHCKTRHLDQQCPENKCTNIGSRSD